MDNRFDITRVLVIDDEKDIRDGSERILTRIGCQVFKASRGEEGLDILKNEAISIILLDLKMPGMDGIEVLRHIKEIDPEILVIVITGYATVETAIQAMKQGAYDFIPKPFEPDQLRIVVSRAKEKVRLTLEAEKLEYERKRTLSDLDTEKSRIRTIIESLPNGVVVTNASGDVVLLNPAFIRLLNLSLQTLPGEKISHYVKDDGFCRLVTDISYGKYSDSDEVPEYEFSQYDDKFLQARGRSVLGEEKECLGAVVVLVDITHLKMLDRLKSDFVAKVSHELRSPLSTIHEQLATVIKDMVEEESKMDQWILSRAKEKTLGLISLIGDLLDLSRIEQGSAFQDPKEINVGELLRNIVDFLKNKAAGKNQIISLSLPEYPLPNINADMLAIESVFGNLITNAINYTQDGGEISVNAFLDKSFLCVEVIDNGFGMEEKHFKKIFEKFYRVKNEKTRNIIGTGLGLSIVKGIIDNIGGSIEVKSKPEQGTTFTVFLPIIKHNI